MKPRTAFRTCPICEASCGLALTLDGERVVRVRGDEHDVTSRGYLCPKGAALGELHHDPDRLRTPLVRGPAGLREASWDEAFAEIERLLVPLIERHGRGSVAVYVGNPTAHDYSLYSYFPALLMAAGTHQLYTAGTVDQQPKQVAVNCMYGTAWGIPVPDVDRTRYLLVLGANPSASNGSLLVAPDLQGRLDAIRARGGRVVVVDPRRTRTAERADEWLPIRPGTDALFLFALVNTLFSEGRVALGALAPHVNGVDALRELAAEFTPEAVEARCRIPAATIRRVARELAGAESAAVYGRVGTCTQAFGTLASWGIDALNVLTGNLDRVGGVMWSRPLAGGDHTRGAKGRGPEFQVGRFRTRVRGAPEVLFQLPAACLAEEIDTPGEGRIRALVVLAGNPALSVPGGERLDRALAQLDCLISLDLFVNETARFAHVVLPAPSPLQQPHYDALLYQVAVRNAARYSKPVLALDEDALPEWQILLRLAAIFAGQGAQANADALDDAYYGARLHALASDPSSPIHGRDVAELAALAAGLRGPERILDLELRTGPYGDAFGAVPGGLSLAELERHPHGLDLGPLEPALPDVLRTPSGRIELAHPYLAADVPRLRKSLSRGDDDTLLLIGRRDLRSNNSWLHNAPSLMTGRERCTLLVHPDDAAKRGLGDGDLAQIRSAAATLVVAVEVSDEVARGVVCLPHGFGHGRAGARLSVAARRPGVNSNALSDARALDVPSGTAVVNGIPVEVARA
ncbi:MAG: molybdopterin-dependent oxidoreductase [Myxococcota bacterium]